MKLAKCVMKKHKKCVVSENSCSKIFVNFQEKHAPEIAFLNKVAGYVCVCVYILPPRRLLPSARCPRHT